MNQREKILVVLAVLIALVMGVPMVLGAVNSSQSTDEKIARLHSDRKEKLKEADSLLAQTQALRPQVEALAYNVSAENLRQSMVERVSALAQNAGFSLTTTRPRKPRPLDVMSEVSVDLHMTTTLSNLVKFLYPLQAPGSRLSVDRLRVTSTNADTDMLDVDLTVSGYTLQVPVEAKTTVKRSVS